MLEESVSGLLSNFGANRVLGLLRFLEELGHFLERGV